MPGNFVMKMHLNSNNRNKQITKPQQQVQPPQQVQPSKNNFNLRAVINAPMRSSIFKNAGKADCGCGGRH